MFAVPLPNGSFLYTLTREEEVLLVDSLLCIGKFVPPTEHWYREFDESFFKEGKALLPRQLNSINLHLKRRNLPVLEFVSSEADDYTIKRGTEKAEMRRYLRESLQTMKVSLRKKLIERSRNEAATLVPLQPTPLYIQTNHYKSPRETVRRFAPLLQAPQPEAASSPSLIIDIPPPQIAPSPQIVVEPVVEAVTLLEPAKETLAEEPIKTYRLEINLPDASEALQMLNVVLSSRAGKVETLEEGRLIRVWG